MTLPAPTKIVCVGRNYRKHAEELGNVVPDRPLLFLKPPSALIGPGDAIVLPPESGQVEHEAEIGVVIGARCRLVDEEDAMRYVVGYRALNDVTARDLQRTDGQWTRAKGFDTFCPIGPLAPSEDINWQELAIRCTVDGELRQSGRAADMAFGIPVLVSYISGIMTLEPGDLVATGTPEGVGPLRPGSVVEVEIPGLSVVRNPVVGRASATDPALKA